MGGEVDVGWKRGLRRRKGYEGYGYLDEVGIERLYIFCEEQ